MKHSLPSGFSKDIVGYCDPLSVLPGQAVGFRLSAWNEAVGARARASIVRLISGDDRPHGTGLIEEHVQDLGETPELEHQALVPGSYGVVAELPGAASAEVTFLFYPTLLRPQAQTLLRWGDLQISVSEQGVFARSNVDELVVTARLQERRWCHLQLSMTEVECALHLQQNPGGPAEEQSTWHASGALGAPRGGVLYLACTEPGQAHFNGRLETLTFTADGADLASYDFSQQMHTQNVVDVSGNGYHGVLKQNPTRAVQGSAWDGSCQNYADAPEHYAAVHFHEDDLTDAEWLDTLSWTVPDDLDSDVYALKVTCQESEDYIPFFVRAHEHKRKDLAYLVPTASYLAYANQRLAFAGGIFGAPKFHHANEAFLYAHEDVAFSMYEYHRDRSGVHFSSRLRPVLNLKPRMGTWAFCADTHITAWLHEIDMPYDVITDEDLHLQGEAALEGYRTVITGTHPEYYSTPMLDALEGWLKNNGRLMYMGGNGFYWRVAFQPDNPAIMEVRRAEDGTRAWVAEPGEYYQQFNGEYGGLWRRLGRPPNRLVGVGFAAQGFDGGTYYRVQSGALDPRVAFALEGITETDTLGAYGNQGGGAAGEEIDRWDVRLGSPAHAVVIASSENHRPGMLKTKEEFHMIEPLGDDPDVRADMVFFEVPGGGAVFSTGSISYCGALAHNQYDNDIARLTGNVLKRFLDETPFPMPA